MKTIKRVTAALLALAVLGTPLAAMAGKGMGRNMPSFSDCDLDGDGRILEEEFNEARSKRISERAQQGYQMRNLRKAPSFTDIDANGDEEISTDEFTTHLSLHRQQRAQ